MATVANGLGARVPDSDEEAQHSAATGAGGGGGLSGGDPQQSASRGGVPTGGDSSTDAPMWLQPIIQILAETQLELATKGTNNPVKPRAALATLKLEEFRGGRETTTYQYRAWKKQAMITQKLYGLTDAELALIIYTQARGRAKQLLEILEVDDLEKPDGLEMVWKILDRAHERMEHERADDAYSAWESAHRKPGQSIDEWLTYLRKRTSANRPMS